MDDDSEPQVALTALDPGQKWVMRVRALLTGLVPTAVSIAADFVSEEQLGTPFGYLSGLAIALYTVAAMGLPGRRFRRWGYQMGEGAIRIACGLWVRRETIVPFARVQHIDVSRGPIERAFGVATLTLHTAGSYNSTVVLPGLAYDDANIIRETIRSHIREDSP